MRRISRDYTTIVSHALFRVDLRNELRSAFMNRFGRAFTEEQAHPVGKGLNGIAYQVSTEMLDANYAYQRSWGRRG